MAGFDPLTRDITGREACHLAVPGTGSALALSVVLFKAIEKTGAATEVRIELPHPQHLARADYLIAIRYRLHRGYTNAKKQKGLHANAL